MPIHRELFHCPKCGRPTLERETWASTQEYHQECRECGYFCEFTWAFRGESKEELTAMHFHRCGEGCIRKGFLKKPPEYKGKFLIIDTWFSSPTRLRVESVQWLDEDEEDELMNPGVTSEDFVVRGTVKTKTLDEYLKDITGFEQYLKEIAHEEE